jgi:hypothetical protein
MIQGSMCFGDMQLKVWGGHNKMLNWLFERFLNFLNIFYMLRDRIRTLRPSYNTRMKGSVKICSQSRL